MNIENIVETPLPGLKRVLLKKWQDERGSFLKILQGSVLRNSWNDFKTSEIYFSVSRQNVLRGMHFQLPPHSHDKIVYCQTGRILDVVLDLRRDSPSYKKFFSWELKAEVPTLMLIPRGMAHGFLSLEENSTVMYIQNSEYHSESDCGVLWNSFGFTWPRDGDLILSPRDRAFATLEQFETPF